MADIKIDKIIRSSRKTIALVVSNDASLIVRAPLRVSLEYIQNLVFKKRTWIDKKKQQVLQQAKFIKNKEFVDGEVFLYLGQLYKLKIWHGENIVLTDVLNFPTKYLKVAKQIMTAWYKQRALEIITDRAKFYSQLTGWKYKTIKITGAVKRWGSCGPSGSINFSWRLAMAPLAVIDYVVLHELAHVVEKNHAAKFWQQVKRFMPDYKIRQKWLKENGKLLSL
ncbi:MAG TPA: SprT family zinc-dependent metalloprotease [bacterium]|nr:SprT family zinc-dependent metalloprotease [bacterium]